MPIIVCRQGGGFRISRKGQHSRAFKCKYTCSLWRYSQTCSTAGCSAGPRPGQRGPRCETHGKGSAGCAPEGPPLLQKPCIVPDPQSNCLGEKMNSDELLSFNICKRTRSQEAFVVMLSQDPRLGRVFDVSGGYSAFRDRILEVF
eukprot:jgi/Botrbrau1/5102/Bobra.0128s0013.1